MARGAGHGKTPKDTTAPLSDSGDEGAVLAGSDDTGVEEENVSPDETITQPFDPTQIRVDSKQLTIDLLITRMRLRELDLATEFQREAGIWNDGAQSRLIESILIRIPLPAFYIDATNDNKWLVVDGLQRLFTLRRFVIANDLRLQGLEFLSSLTGKTFEDLPRNFQRRIVETQVTVYSIESGTPREVKFNIFKRINTGGLPLSSQEIRHALNQGPVTEFLLQLARSREFLNATDSGIRGTSRMADRECVLRFLAFTHTSFRDYKTKDFDGFLNDEMAAINEMSDSQRHALQQRFRKAMIAAYRLFGRYAFRKRYAPGGWRYPISKALFEAWSVNLGQTDDDNLALLEKRKDKLTDGFLRLMNNNAAFHAAISQGTGDPNRVRLRFGEIEKLIREVLE